MPLIYELRALLERGAFDHEFAMLYPGSSKEEPRGRYLELLDAFELRFGRDREAVILSVPGRTEICGNHTDHQRGKVLAAAVNLDIICVASISERNVIRVCSKGYPEDVVALDSLSPKEDEKGHSTAMIRGVADWFNANGCMIGGFDACTASNVLGGSGLSSSAAFEVAVGTILSHLYNGGAVSPVNIAIAGQYAENVHFGKPCGLMDQTASSVGGFVRIDFADVQNPEVERISFDPAREGVNLCIVDTKGSHADLTPDYAAIPAEMSAAARLCGGSLLGEVAEDDFYARIPAIRKEAGDRAVLRAIHFFSENGRVEEAAAALRQNRFSRFLDVLRESGESSAFCLQNIYSCSNPREQGLSLALALSKRLLEGEGGAWRVHGGGFAGTIQAFVPSHLLEKYRETMDGVFGNGACHVLSIRPVGGYLLSAE